MSIEMPSKLIYNLIEWVVKKLIKWLQRHEVKGSGNINLGKVSSQGHINNFFPNCDVDDTSQKLKVGDLTEYFKNYVAKNIPSQYLKNHDGSDSKKFIINNTRISTFFVFTDDVKVLLFDRTNSNLQNIINNNYDCFGSVDFENSSLSKKITNQSFFGSDIEKIDYVPGFAFEDNVETKDNFCVFQTAIMFGFVFYISTQDLKSAVKNNKNLHLENLNEISTDTLTSKAKLAVEYLRSKKDCRENKAINNTKEETKQ